MNACVKPKSSGSFEVQGAKPVRREGIVRQHVAMCFLGLALARQAVYRYSVQESPISFERMRNELLHAQFSIVRDLTTGKHYAIPSQVTLSQEEIYQIFRLRRSAVPYPINK